MSSSVPGKDLAAFRETRRAAEAGQPKAQYNLGLMYANGVGVEQDFNQAIFWYHKAAEKGVAAAQYILAGKYAAGQGVEKDLRQALNWYLKASDRGNSKALFKLGQILSVPQDEFASICFEQAAEKGVVEAQLIVGAKYAETDGQQAKAGDWYQKAAENGAPAAQYVIGLQFVDGKSVRPDFAIAAQWFRKSARQGYAAAQTQLGMMYIRGEGVPKDNRQGFAWLARAADQGDVEAQYQLAQMYAQGVGVAADAIEAEKWFIRAADQGDLRSQLHLGLYYEDSQPILAVEMYERASALGSAEAKLALGRLYAGGLGFEPDYDKALGNFLLASQAGVPGSKLMLARLLDREILAMTSHWYRVAAEEGDPDAQCALANRLSGGEGLLKDESEAAYWYRQAAVAGVAYAEWSVGKSCHDQGAMDEAVEWYRRSAKQGFAKAQCALGCLYAHGDGVTKDNRQAANWLLKAAEQGDPEAQYQLGLLFEKSGGIEGSKHARQWYTRAHARSPNTHSGDALLRLVAKAEAVEAEQVYLTLAEQGFAEAQVNLAECLLRRQGGRLKPDSLEWLLKAAVQGDSRALLKMAELGRVQNNDLVEACLALARQNPLGEAGGIVSSQAGLPVLSEAEKLRQLAEGGDPVAQWRWARTIVEVSGQDPAKMSEAVAWFRRAAQSGLPAAQAALAVSLSIGEGGRQSDEEAVYWWLKSAEQGDLESQYNLALMYEKGRGVVRDPVKAVFWYEKAAMQGVSIAQLRLGLAFATGGHGTQDYVLAYAWFALAAAAGNEAAQANREHAERLMNPVQLREGRHKVDELSKEIRRLQRLSKKNNG